MKPKSGEKLEKIAKCNRGKEGWKRKVKVVVVKGAKNMFSN